MHYNGVRRRDFMAKVYTSIDEFKKENDTLLFDKIDLVETKA